MKKSFLVILPLILLVGCQSYPKNPSNPSIIPSIISEYYDVNKSLPTELKGVNYTLVKYPDSDFSINPKSDNPKSDNLKASKPKASNKISSKSKSK